MRRNSGVYVYRTKKPGAILGLPFVGHHFGYVGETNHFGFRHVEHTQGGGKYNAEAKPWADLNPRVAFRISLPPWKWLMRLVETLVILLVWPVYNDRKNRWNPRRIPLDAQKRQRAARDKRGWSFNIRPIHVAMILIIILATIALHK